MDGGYPPGTLITVLLDKQGAVGLWDHEAAPFSRPEESARGFPRWPHRLPFPPRVDGLPGLRVSAAPWPPSLDAGCPDRCEGIALVVLMRVSLILGDGQRLSVCLLATCVSSWEKRLFPSSARVSIGMFVTVACGRCDHLFPTRQVTYSSKPEAPFPQAAVVTRILTASGRGTSRPNTKVLWKEGSPGSLISG